MGIPRLRMLVTCDGIAFDPNGKLTLYGIFDIVWAKSFPVALPGFYVAISCYVDDPTTLRLRFEKPDGSILTETPALVEASSQSLGLIQATYHFLQMAFPSDGTYQIKLVTEQGTEVASCDLQVRKQQNVI